MNRRLALTGALAWALLAGCSDAPSSGQVVSTRSDGAHYDTYLYCAVYTPLNNIPVCTMWLPYQQYVAANWSLKLRNGTHAGWVDVPETTYRRCGATAQYPACAGSTT